ncbi:MAG: hypothetical protein PHW18_10730 [Sulfuricurvum sp.]|uniref:CBU_0592 family membrane protein n=1 Tax=Sulfuricurvum sp. TaxID=2025608 RepID=UPI002632B00F|nr:hypothetical protein [Sulfuricurvum sp.]MDD2830038.1 hypothetical protein [Sulfuricurvum sp.]MDD4948359.1 hypothetical protein [Sulfuricurvum sp.]
MNPIFGDIIGIIGVFIIVVAYILMQVDRMNPKGFSFSLLNTLGAIMILISLFYSWNLASFIMEAIWFTLSLYGTLKAYRTIKHSR